LPPPDAIVPEGIAMAMVELRGEALVLGVEEALDVGGGEPSDRDTPEPRHQVSPVKV
jgi:hypothetical protein